MGRIDKLYEKFNGSYFAFLGAGISLISIFIAIILYVAVDPNFTIMTHYISDLGDGRNYSNVVFNISHIIMGIIFIFSFYYLSMFLRNKEAQFSTWYAFMGGFLYSLGLILVGIFPSKMAYEIHIIGAAFVFFGMFFSYVFYGISEFKISEINKKLAILGFIFSPLPIIFMSFLLLHFTVGFPLKITLFIEWITYFTMLSWIIIHGIYTLNSK